MTYDLLARRGTGGRHLSIVELIDFSGECWEWLGYRQPEGYGRIAIEGTMRYAHRLIYEVAVGPIPEGLTIDHLCRNPPCVNPDHLEPVTIKVNLLRGTGVGALNAVKTSCHRGHPFTEENTYRAPKNGKRNCRECMRLRLERYRRKEAS